MYAAFLGVTSLSCHFPVPTTPPDESHTEVPAPVGPTVLPLTIINLTSTEGSRGKFFGHVSWSAQELAPFGVGVMTYRYMHEPLSGPVNVTSGDDPRLTMRLNNDGSVYVFIVDDINLEGSPKNGFQSKRDGLPFFVVERTASQITWAHEIGHLLELGHDPSVNNIMCSCDKKRKDPHFSAEQGEVMRHEARRLVLEWWGP